MLTHVDLGRLRLDKQEATGHGANKANATQKGACVDRFHPVFRGLP